MLIINWILSVLLLMLLFSLVVGINDWKKKSIFSLVAVSLVFFTVAYQGNLNLTIILSIVTGFSAIIIGAMLNNINSSKIAVKLKKEKIKKEGFIQFAKDRMKRLISQPINSAKGVLVFMITGLVSIVLIFGISCTRI